MDKYFWLLLLIETMQVSRAVVHNFIVVNETYDISRVLQSSNYYHIGQYKLLHVVYNCKISQCHGSTQESTLYHSHCFASQCPYKKYHCLSGSGKIIHFCAEFDDCKPRSKDIAVFNELEPDLVHVYNVPCEYGYFQPNDKHSCFQPCDRDTSIAIVQTSGNTSEAYCLPDHGCNPFRKLFFELGTKHDDCTGINQCSTSQDLLPNCSCVDHCPQNHVRLPENRFICSPRVEREIPSNSDPKEPSMPTLTVPGGRRDNDIVHEAQDNHTYSTGFEKRLNPVENNSGPIVTTVAIVAMIVFGCVALIVIGVSAGFLWKLTHTHNQTNFTNNYTATNLNVCERDNINVGINGPEPDADGTKSNSECRLSFDDEQKIKLLKDPDNDNLAQTNMTREDASLTFPKQEYTEN